MEREDTHCKKDVWDIHTHVHGITDGRHVDKIAPSVRQSERRRMLKGGDVPDEPERDKMVGDEFVVVLAWFFKTEKQDDELLAPVSRMNKIVSFQSGQHIPERIAYGEKGIRM